MNTLLKPLLVIVLVTGILRVSQAQESAFTYQGRLDSAGLPVEGWHDLQFSLHSAESGGSPLGTVLTNAVPVVAGLFAVTLDFGASVWDGSARWLEIGVRTNGVGVFTILSPRQAVSAAPYAITASQLSGALPSAALSGTYGEAVALTNAVNVLAGDGSGITGLSASALSVGSVPPEALGYAWKIGGNSGTLAGTHFVGTTDNQPLEMAANNQRVLRLEPAPETPNLIGGVRENSVAPGVRGATIAGGGLPAYPNQVTADFASVGGGTFHISGGPWATIAGGRDNRVYAESATIAGGFRNGIETNSEYGFIGGGAVNRIESGSTHMVIAGGANNLSRTQVFASVIGGGYLNLVDTNASYAVIGGGRGNSNLANTVHATIGGGWRNRVGPSVNSGTVAGGENNWAAANHATVGGGLNNLNLGPGATISGGNGNVIIPNDAVIAGGIFNQISTNSFNAVVGGGILNQVGTNSSNAVISGGRSNQVAAAAVYGTVSGGHLNMAGASEATVSGGVLNQARGFSSTIGGGGANVADGQWSNVAGGAQNRVETNTIGSTIAGGLGNFVGTNASTSFLGGGWQNRLDGDAHGVVAGGFRNVISENAYSGTIVGGVSNRVGAGTVYGTVGGGLNNMAAGSYSVVPGGRDNVAGGTYGFAAGRRAKAVHAGSFVWADNTDADFTSGGPNQFVVRAAGGVGIGTGSPTARLHVAGTPGVDGIRFPDGTLQTTAASAAAPPVVAFASGSGNAPAVTNRFLAEPATVTIAGPSQQVLVTSNKALGSTVGGGANNLTLYIGWRPVGSTATINLVGPGVFGNRVPANTRVTMGLSAVITGLPAGSYHVGLVGASSEAVNWNSNEYSYTTAVVY